MQYALTLEDLPAELHAKLEQLKLFLDTAFVHGTVANWTCLESLPNCERQAIHSDYVRAQVRRATQHGNFANLPFACKYRHESIIQVISPFCVQVWQSSMMGLLCMFVMARSSNASPWTVAT